MHIPGGPPCFYSQKSRGHFIIIHTNGIHEVQVTFCRCRADIEFRTQLLRYAWWPATSTDPQTCTTREALRLFHLLNLQGNLTPTDFYRSLEQLTDSRKLLKLPVRTKIIIVCMNLYSILTIYTGSSFFLHEHSTTVAQCESGQTSGQSV